MRSFPKLLPLVLVSCLLAPGPGLSAQQPAPTPQVASYTIAATLDAANRLIVGQGRLNWRNTTVNPVPDLRIVTPWNARRHDRTTWANGRRLAHPKGTPRVDDTNLGFMDLTSLTLATGAGPVDLLARATAMAPEDGNADDHTVWTIPLDQPLAPGQIVEIEFKWNAHVPALADRAGAVGQFFLAGQWFPAIGVLGEDGWHAHQVHFALPGYSDFGSYQVDLRLPSGWSVGATGREAGRQDHGDGSTTHRYRAENVADFAWATGPALVERTDRFAQPGLPPVELRILLQRAQLAQADRHLAAAKAALKTYGETIGPYPWPQLTIVDTPPESMSPGPARTPETRSYPGLLVIHTRRGPPWSDPDPELQIVAEVGNQIWRAKSAPDGLEHAWLATGVNAFMTARVMHDALNQGFVKVERYFGGLVAWPYADVRWNRLTDGASVASLRRARAADASSTPSWQQHPATRATNLGARTPLMLTTLERLLGWDMMQAILSRHSARGAFRHPTPDEFFSIANSVSGRDLSWFFDATHRRAATFDYGVRTVTGVPTDTDSIDSTVVVERLAPGIFPVEVRVAFDDGSSVVERWDGERHWRALRYLRAARVVTVEVDPDRVLALDIDRTNNSWTSQPHARQAATRWTLRWALWLQHVLLTYAFFA